MKSLSTTTLITTFFLFIANAFCMFESNPYMAFLAQKKALHAIQKKQETLPNIISRKVAQYEWAMKPKDFRFWLRRYLRSTTTHLHADVWKAYHTSYSPVARRSLILFSRANLKKLAAQAKILSIMSFHIRKSLREEGDKENTEAYDAFEKCQKKQWQKTQKMLQKMLLHFSHQKKRVKTATPFP